MNASNGKLRILVLRDPGFRMDDGTEQGEVAAALADEPNIKVVEATAGYGEALRAVQRADADLVIIDEVAGDPCAVVEQIDDIAPELPIVVVLEEEQRMLAQASILAGARAYLFRPFELAELLEVVRRVHAKEDRRKKKTERGASQTGRIIAVHGAKGGVGTTTVSINLAVAMAKATGKRVALLDLNLMGGDVAVSLNIVTDNSIADVVAHLRELDGDLLDATMVHHPSGVAVLPSPTQLERAEAITGEETAKVLIACKAHFDVVVVDTASRPDEHVLAALDLADTILLVATPEIVCLKNTARFLGLSHEIGYGRDKIRLVVNRVRSAGSLPLADIEESLQHEMSFGVSSDGVPIIASLNAGEPVVTMRSDSRVARELRTIATELAGQFGTTLAAPTAGQGASRPSGRAAFGLLTRLIPSRAAAK